MKIVADENIAGLQEYFSAYGEIIPLEGRSISAKDLQQADALLVRSVTAVNQALLERSTLRFVGSCTIGTDHLDTEWLDQQQIHWAHAPGCNAKAVVDYVLACLLTLEVDLTSAVVGIVGCGSVGGLLERQLSQLGISTLCCDPFLPSTQKKTYIALEQMLPLCDVLCLHTPLTKTGAYPTWHLVHENNLVKMKKNALLLNAGRGAVVDNLALLKHMEKYPDFRAVLDVWENEPKILPSLLEQATLATPHIAGYSLAGKWRGTEMVHQNFCQFFGWPVPVRTSVTGMIAADRDPAVSLRDYVLAVYDPCQDSCRLKEISRLPEAQRAAAFDNIRKQYVARRELGALVGRS
jgi:erythronate-4-phosphate dehydrogenase